MNDKWYTNSRAAAFMYNDQCYFEKLNPSRGDTDHGGNGIQICVCGMRNINTHTVRFLRKQTVRLIEIQFIPDLK